MKNNQKMIKKVQLLLQWVFWVPVALTLLTTGLGEADVLPVGVLAENKEAEFVLASIMEILAIVAIPLALKLFKLKPIANRLAAPAGVSALRLWGVVRLSLLCVPMMVNIVSYYLFMWVGFAYLAIILLLSLFFVYPSLSRCYNEAGSSNS